MNFVAEPLAELRCRILYLVIAIVVLAVWCAGLTWYVVR